MATRRSPRTIERFCNSLTFDGCTGEQTALLLSLAQCTGWSADRISLKMKEFMKAEKRFRAEDVWSFHWRWILSRSGSDTASMEETEIMKFLMKEAGVELARMGTPLNRTVQPTTVAFRPKWSPKSDDGRPLVDGFTPTTREISKSWLAQQKQSTSTYAKPTTMEEEVINVFGSTMSLILKDILKRWVKAMRSKLRSDPALRPIREREHVMLIMEYLGIFQDAFETCFGLMEHTKKSALGHIKDDTVYIQSTGYAAKVFLGLLMADRLHVIEQLRREEREEIGFVQVEAGSLAEDCRNCPICQDPLGVESPEGIKETPVKLVVCCGQVIGESCMKAWLSEFAYADVQRDSCPVCRFVFPAAFIEKLFGQGEEDLEAEGDDIDDDDKEIISLITPTPLPERAESGEGVNFVPGQDGFMEEAWPQVTVGDSVNGDGAADEDVFMMEG